MRQRSVFSGEEYLGFQLTHGCKLYRQSLPMMIFIRFDLLMRDNGVIPLSYNELCKSFASVKRILLDNERRSPLFNALPVITVRWSKLDSADVGTSDQN